MRSQFKTLFLILSLLGGTQCFAQSPSSTGPGRPRNTLNLGDLPLKGPDTDFRVMFWNIWKDQITYGDNPRFRAQLNSLLHHSETLPDFLFFAEYKKGLLGNALEERLREEFSYVQFVPNRSSEDDGPGLLVMSQFEAMAVDFQSNMPFWPENTSIRKIESMKTHWEKRLGIDAQKAFAQLSFEIENTKIHFIPLHLNMPWTHFKSRHSNFVDALTSPCFTGSFLPSSWKESLDSLNNRWKKFDELCDGRENINFYQLEAYINKIQAPESGIDWEQDVVILLGDMNFHSSKYFRQSEGYQFLVEEVGFIDTFKGSSESTFPTPLLKEHEKYPSVKIDHIFIWDPNELLGYQATILKNQQRPRGRRHRKGLGGSSRVQLPPWASSDHYPVMSDFFLSIPSL